MITIELLILFSDKCGRNGLPVEEEEVDSVHASARTNEAEAILHFFEAEAILHFFDGCMIVLAGYFGDQVYHAADYAKHLGQQGTEQARQLTGQTFQAGQDVAGRGQQAVQHGREGGAQAKAS